MSIDTTPTRNDELYGKVRAQLAQELGRDTEAGIHVWLNNYLRNPEFLLAVGNMLLAGTCQKLEDAQRNTRFSVADNRLDIINDSGAWSYDKNTAIRCMQLFCDALCDYLPLGSLLELDQSQLLDIPGAADLKSIKVVITQRLVSVGELPVFFPYGGVIYPLGAFKDLPAMYFSQSLVKEVLHLGYRDEADDTFVMACINELVFSRLHKSVFWADEDLRIKAQACLRP